MKIDGMNHSQMMVEQNYNKKNEGMNSKQAAFDKLVSAPSTQETAQENKIIEMVDNIEEVKTLLEQDLSVENLEKYKETLRSFLDYYTKNELKMDYYYVRDSRTFMEKKVGIIQNINGKMNEMTENMLETNKGNLELLNKIGEIKGLIVNLFV